MLTKSKKLADARDFPRAHTSTLNNMHDEACTQEYNITAPTVLQPLVQKLPSLPANTHEEYFLFINETIEKFDSELTILNANITAQLPIIQVYLPDGQPSSSLLDSGATRSFMDLKLGEKFINNENYTRTVKGIKIADQSIIYTLGILTTHITIVFQSGRRLRVNMQFMIINNAPFSLIFGRDSIVNRPGFTMTPSALHVTVNDCTEVVPYSIRTTQNLLSNLNCLLFHNDADEAFVTPPPKSLSISTTHKRKWQPLVTPTREHNYEDKAEKEATVEGSSPLNSKGEHLEKRKNDPPHVSFKTEDTNNMEALDRKSVV